MALIAALANAGAAADWSKWTSELQARGHDVRHESGQLPAAQLDPEVAAVIDGLTPDRVSQPFFVRERIFVARLLGSHDKSATPISEVAPMIQRTLQNKQLQAALEQAGDKALQEAVIVHRSK
jgi:parvulin-like peptidyl-prolyl isomerase